MKQTRLLMGMPITVEIVGESSSPDLINQVFDYFQSIDDRFSVYKENSEISKINRGEIKPEDFSPDMQQIFKLSAETKLATNGYFEINRDGLLDPSGLVKGWSIYQASKILTDNGAVNSYIEAGGDIQANGLNPSGNPWIVGIRNPFNIKQLIKVINLTNQGIATSGTYFRGQHIYNPKKRGEKITEIVSLSVIGPNIYEADRFATAAFAMGKDGVHFIESLPDLEAYSVDSFGNATLTTGFNRYVKKI
jgi:thiamine biosynthesis lipoprotein